MKIEGHELQRTKKGDAITSDKNKKSKRKVEWYATNAVQIDSCADFNY